MGGSGKLYRDTTQMLQSPPPPPAIKSDRSPKGLLLLQFFESYVTFEEYKYNFFDDNFFDDRHELCVDFISLEYFNMHQVFWTVFLKLNRKLSAPPAETSLTIFVSHTRTKFGWEEEAWTRASSLC